MRLIGNVEKDAQVRAVASGALPSGDAVIVNSDGTVSVVSGSSVSQAIGSAVQYDAASSYNNVVFDSNNNKIVIAYMDGGNSSYGTAVVGTVSGTSISFGTPVVYESASTREVSATFDSNSNKVVISYKDEGNSNYGTAVIGTVSGTSISFGTPVVYNAGIVYATSIAFDSSTNKVVIAYQDGGNSNYGTAIVGTVSGTTISFGTEVVFASSYSLEEKVVFDSNSNKVVIAFVTGGNLKAIVGTVSGTSISFGAVSDVDSSITYVSAAFDSTANKVVIAYRDGGNSNYGTAIVGTVSGTSISFGAPVVFKAAAVIYTAVVFDSNANKIVITYRDQGNSNYGTLSVGSVSGTSISFDSELVFNTSLVNYTAVGFDSNSNKIVIAYESSPEAGNSRVFQPAYIDTNLTAENFIGFAAHTYADTQSALVNSSCTVDRNQTGLTAGQTYYVQSDGSLGTTAADPSVVAGTAISSTEIIVKG